MDHDEKQKLLIMFDFDGVLVDTLLVCYEINAEVNQGMSLAEYQEVFSGNIYASFGKGKLKVPHPDFGGRYLEKTRELAIPQDMKNLVRALAARAKLAIVSSTPTKSIKAIVEREGLGGCFSYILGSDVDLSKVVKIRSLLEMYSVDPKATIFITDTGGDVHEAHECGVASIGVTWGFQTREMLKKSVPAAIVDTGEELALALQRFFSASAIQ